MLFKPCLPTHWPRAELTLRRDGRTLRFTLARAPTLAALRAGLPSATRLLWPDEPLAWPGLVGENQFLVPLLDAPVPVAAAPAVAAQPG